MPDLSLAYDPASIATNSDAASKAQSEANTASAAAVSAASAASDASSAAVVAQSKASDASSAAAVSATDTVKGKIELATLAEVNAGTDASRAVTPDTLAGSIFGTKTVILKIYDEASAISSGDGKMYFAVPSVLNGMNLVSCGGHLYTAATSGTVEVQINNVTSSVDMLTSKLSWDATEKDTNTATSAAVINTSADGVGTAEEIRIDIDSAASGAKGMEVRLSFRLP